VRSPFTWNGYSFEPGTLVLLDVYGTNHDSRWWTMPDQFAPERFRGTDIDAFTLIPQGGGDVRHGHRCPGEDLTIAIVAVLAERLAQIGYRVRSPAPISLRRIPARPRGGLAIEALELPQDAVAAR